VGEVSNGEFLVAFSIATAAGVGVWFHADRHGSKHASAWAIGVFLFLALMLPVYVIHVWRGRRRARGE
jgi:hypothetical protein